MVVLFAGVVPGIGVVVVIFAGDDVGEVGAVEEMGEEGVAVAGCFGCFRFFIFFSFARGVVETVFRWVSAGLRGRLVVDEGTPAVGAVGGDIGQIIEEMAFLFLPFRMNETELFEEAIEAAGIHADLVGELPYGFTLRLVMGEREVGDDFQVHG